MGGYRKIERTSVPDQIFEQLKQLIIAGKWQQGESLPSEIQLAGDFGVSRMSVRTAIKKLETFGFVEVRMGEGSFVIEMSPAIFFKGLSPIFSNTHNALEIIEFRKALEVECMKLGFKRAEEKDIDVLENIFNEYWKNVTEKQFKKALSFDYRFHHQVFLMSKNSLFKEIYESMSEMFFLHYEENEKLYQSTYGYTPAEQDRHAQVLKAYRKRDLTSAIEAFTKMIDELIAAYKASSTK